MSRLKLEQVLNTESLKENPVDPNYPLYNGDMEDLWDMYDIASAWRSFGGTEAEVARLALSQVDFALYDGHIEEESVPSRLFNGLAVVQRAGWLGNGCELIPDTCDEILDGAADAAVGELGSLLRQVSDIGVPDEDSLGVDELAAAFLQSSGLFNKVMSHGLDSDEVRGFVRSELRKPYSFVTNGLNDTLWTLLDPRCLKLMTEAHTGRSVDQLVARVEEQGMHSSKDWAEIKDRMSQYEQNGNHLEQIRLMMNDLVYMSVASRAGSFSEISCDESCVQEGRVSFDEAIRGEDGHAGRLERLFADVLDRAPEDVVDYVFDYEPVMKADGIADGIFENPMRWTAVVNRLGDVVRDTEYMPARNRDMELAADQEVVDRTVESIHNREIMRKFDEIARQAEAACNPELGD